ncbi:RagB/SusD family nutrient uptake outer membrane protein [Thermophagus xiamenensis]|uniref:SusD family protein n=1 Tax=Thermophagus xiamenensis TaxID=385682 RepID=A0A1I1WE06_9BACT|nr:RagB/SusD family nutrient uptake outer membrane protein [Thermophagus xiamenensis]SFD92618.1 SusD family protein [Thermophagus xiamenensis]
MIVFLKRLIKDGFQRVLKVGLMTLLLVFISGFWGCDFLEVDPIGKTTIPVLFSDMDGIQSALPGAYSAVYEYYDNNFYLYPDVAGDMLSLNVVGGSAEMVEQYNFSSTPDDAAGTVGHIWRYTYEALANINNIIEYQPSLVEKYPQYEDQLNEILAEALFLRALVHFDVCRCYAQPYNYTEDASHPGVPIVLKTPGPDDNLPRSSVAEVYDQILKDLDLAIELFEGKVASTPYYASQEAAYALKARVALYMENWDDVIAYSDILIGQRELTKREDYTDMFNNLEAGDEMIFRLNGLYKSSSLSSFYSPISPVAIPADTLISLFDDPNDIRLELLTDESNEPVCKKFWITAEVSEQEKHYDPIVLRLSEVFLNRAEAYLNKQMYEEAANDVKVIQARATGKDPEDILISYDPVELEKIIDRERAKELCFEGIRFFDITRRKKDLVREASTTSTVQYIAYPSDLFVLPIPEKELNANNNITPNPTVND